MIKVAIAGAATPDAGELIRILVGHPDVTLTSLYEPSRKGEAASAVHHGLIGESVPSFSDRLDTSAFDVLFICRHMAETDAIMSDLENKTEMRIIDLTQRTASEVEGLGFVYGLPEMERKALVRGARRAVVPGAMESVALVALYPLAAHLMLSGDVRLRVEGAAPLLDAALMVKAQNEIASRLRSTQQSFTGNVSITAAAADTRRGLRVRAELDSPMTLPDIARLYEELYDDHNFTFLSPHAAPYAEVAGTDKIIISLSLAQGKLTIDAVADGRMRGGAGEAVHVMNLLFGLAERTGLALKASEYDAC